MIRALWLVLFALAIIQPLFASASPRTQEWLVKIEDKRELRALIQRGCGSRLLNPHLGGDIFLLECSFTPRNKSREANNAWHILSRAAVAPSEPQDPLNIDQWALDSINVREFWGTSTTGDASVKVAIIDSGVDYRHQDLAPNIAINTGEIPGNGLDDDQNGYTDDYLGWDSFSRNGDPMDHFDHGTHIAGIIGAGTNNGIGITGMNWQVAMIPIKFIGSNGGGSTAAAIQAFDYAIARGAKIINLSWAGPNPSPLLEETLNRCREKGVLIVAAAGNEATDNDVIPSYPANYALSLDNMISVAALNLWGELASFSNWGSKSVHIAAPGQSILSTIAGNKYGFKDGTSMAAPHIVGAAALVWAANPGWNYRDVRSFLFSRCSPASSLDGKVSCQGAFRF